MSQIYLKPESIKEGSIDSSKLDKSTFKTINGKSIFEMGDIVLPSVDELDNVTNNKQDVISDLDTIRANAALGATALQSVPEEYATKEFVNAQVANYEGDLLAMYENLLAKHNEFEATVNKVFERLVTPWPPVEEPDSTKEPGSGPIGDMGSGSVGDETPDL